MKRVEFTKMLVKLVLYALGKGYNVVIDYVLRSTEEQNRLFQLGKSRCDGYKVKSKHQLGLAADVYVVNDKGEFVWDREPYVVLHQYWESIGGRPMIEWDLGHFEV
jgi:hypothetical protein